ncbi:MAG: NAD(P)/FAD-dependent oxidoreductase [Firmicutes bacterium]|nr:NAD(P)/FAD-dependent oxidoreductase [Bacillota bacterium]
MKLDQVVDIFSGLHKLINPIQVAVIGGGAAGLTAAIAAAGAGAKVTVLERLDRVGKKILATGNGRCNLSNTDLTLDHYHGVNPRFAHSALSRFDFARTMAFFESLGIAWQAEEDGKVFPMSEQASSVLDVLRYRINDLGVEVRCSAGVSTIKGREGDFTLELADGDQVSAQRVIIATGGRAAPNLGSDGSGYSLARQLGHSVVEPFPALVPLKLAAGFLKSISGVKFTGSATVLAGDRPIKTAAGEILFTDYGISGPPILALSRVASEYLHKSEVWLKLNLFSAMSADELRQLVDRRLETQAAKSLAFSFVGLINKRLIPVLLKEAEIKDPRKPAGQLTGAEREAVQTILQDWRFQVSGARAWPSAQVTAGGVNVSEVDPKTMASKLTPGIYFAGELMDIDGDCGGYNLQWAWSSGFIAGESAATEQKKI